MPRKRWRLLKMFLCFKMLTNSLKYYEIIGKKGVSEILYVTGRNRLSQEETNIQVKKLPVTGRDLPSQYETSSPRKKLPVTQRSI
jgi:hypothetical protein